MALSGENHQNLSDSTLRHIYSVSKEKCDAWAGHLILGGGTRGGPVLHHGRGCRVWDTANKSYIDCTSQSWALYLGYCHEELWQTINEHAQNLTHVHQGFDCLTRFALAKKLADIMPEGMDRVSLVPSSALAIEGAMKLCIKNRPGAKYFMALWDGYHGTTHGTMGASWISTQSNGSFIGGSRFLGLTNPVIRVPNPYCYRCYFGQKPDSCNMMCARMLELTIQKGVNGPAAGLILEPVQASGGQIPAPRRYMEAVREICSRHHVPLIFDEIQTYMRIGKITAAEYYGVKPEFICLGKAVGGGLPLGVTVVRNTMQGFQPDTEELHTFANNSLSQVGALKQIEIVERDKILENTNNMGSYLKEGLLRLQRDFPEMGDIRQMGLHIGVEFVKDPQGKEPLEDATRAIRDAGMKRGVIFGYAGVRKNVLKIKPPLIVNEVDCDEILELLAQSLKDALR